MIKGRREERRERRREEKKEEEKALKAEYGTKEVNCSSK